MAASTEDMDLVASHVALGEAHRLVSQESRWALQTNALLFQAMLSEQEVYRGYSFSRRKKGNPFSFVNRLFIPVLLTGGLRDRKSEKSSKDKEEASRWDEGWREELLESRQDLVQGGSWELAASKVLAG